MGIRGSRVTAAWRNRRYDSFVVQVAVLMLLRLRCRWAIQASPILGRRLPGHPFNYLSCPGSGRDQIYVNVAANCDVCHGEGRSFGNNIASPATFPPSIWNHIGRVLSDRSHRKRLSITAIRNQQGFRTVGI